MGFCRLCNNPVLVAIATRLLCTAPLPSPPPPPTQQLTRLREHFNYYRILVKCHILVKWLHCYLVEYPIPVEWPFLLNTLFQLNGHFSRIFVFQLNIWHTKPILHVRASITNQIIYASQLLLGQMASDQVKLDQLRFDQVRLDQVRLFLASIGQFFR